MMREKPTQLRTIHHSENPTEKPMKKILASIIASILGCGLALAQVGNTPVVVGGGGGGALQPAIALDSDGAPVSLPIGSLSQLKGWALEQVTAGEIGMSCPSLADVPGTVTNYGLPRDPAEVPNRFAARLLSQRFSFSLFDVRDWINVQARLSSDRSTLFEGSYPTKVYDMPGGGTGFRIQGLEMRLSAMIRFPVGNVTNALLYHRDQWGNVEYVIPLYVYDGGLYFPSKYAGTDGQIVTWVRRPNGAGYSQVAYDLKGNGSRILPTAASGTTSGAIENSFDLDVTAQDGVIRYFFVTAKVGWGNTPAVVRIVVTGTPTSNAAIIVPSVLVGYDGRLMGVPTSATLRREGAGLDSTQSVPVRQDGSVRLDLPPGTYYLGLDSEIYREYLPQPTIEDGNNDGKGGPQIEPVKG